MTRYRPRVLHEMMPMWGSCARCGLTQFEYNMTGRDCMTDAELAEQKEWKKAAEIAAARMAKRK